MNTVTCRRITSFTTTFLIAVNLVGCAVTGTYPENWPEVGRSDLVGKCPSIAGKYRNLGIHHPSDARPLSLTELLGLQNGDQVDIVQSPDTISVSVWASGKHVETVSFASGELGIGWDISRPRTFICPLEIPSGRVLSFAHLERGGTQLLAGSYGAGMFSLNASRVSKGADGSLVIKLQSGGGALIALFPVGKVEIIWYRFEPVER